MLFSGVAWLIGCASLSHVPQAQQMAQRPSAYPLGIISAGYAPEFHMADSLRDRWHGVKEATAVNTVLVAPLMAECLATAAAPGPWFGLSPAFCLPLLAIFIPGLDSLGNKGVLEKLESVERDIVRQINGSDTQSALAGAVARYLQSIGNGADLVVVSDIPGDVRIRQDTQFLPYNPGNYAQNSKQNPLRGNSWIGPFDPRGYVGPGIAPYFGNRQGPGFYGEMGTGAI